MQYDVTLKLLLSRSADFTIGELTGTTVAKWLDVELPKIQNLRLDLLGETAEGELIHLELQSSNDPGMALRMAEYCLGVYRQCQKFPRQVLIYVGEAPLRMSAGLSAPNLSFRYELVDIRTLDGDRLLESEQVGDNVIAILTSLRDDKEAVRKIVTRLAGLPAAERAVALQQLLIVAGLRRLAGTVEQEVRKMPVYIDILENEVLGREFKKGLQEGRQEGRQEGELRILRKQLETRFGTLPSWAEQRLAEASTERLEELATRLLNAGSLEDLLR